MLQNKSKYPTVYNPASQSPEEIVSNFVIRLREFNELFEAIKNEKMEKPPQHFIVQGQRGYGKTTLLLRLDLAIKNDPDLDQWLLPVMFSEEQYNIHTLAKLWEEVIDILEDQYDSFAGLSDEIDPLYDGDSPEEKIFELLINALKKENRRIVLFLDNFGDMIEKFSRKENQRLREILITCKHIRIVGTSSAILEFYYNYREPLYDFFKVITLDVLNGEETVQLLRKLSKTYGADEINKIIETQPERIEALRRLTGGVPRTIVLLFEIFIDDVDGNSFKDLETILDRVTPLYKHRMDNLPVQQQTIVDALAQNWDAMSTKDIARKVRMPSKAVSSQLNQLEKSQLVTKISTSTKNHLYQISERFFNIYYLMRLGRRKNRNRVLWLVRFFELWCSESELAERTQRHIKSLQEKKLYQAHAFWISQALSRTAIPDELQHELIAQTREYLSSAQNPLAKELDKSHIEVRNEASALIESGDIDLAERKLSKETISRDRIDLFIGNVLETKKKDFAKAIEFYLRAVKGGNVNAMFNLALLFQNEYKEYDEAKKYYLMAVEKGHVSAIYNLALLFENEYKEYDEARKYYLMAVEKGNVEAMNNLGLLYKSEYKQYDEAKKYYLMAVEKGDAKAMYNLALLYKSEYKQYDEAKKYYLMAVEKGHANAMYNLALLYKSEYKNYEEAKKYYLMAVEKGHANAMYNLALLYKSEYKNYEEAKKYYLMAVEKGDVEAMNNLGLLYKSEYKQYDEARKYYLMAVEKGHANAMYNLALLYKSEYKNYEEAKKYYLMAVEKGHVSAMYNLALLFENEYKKYDEAKKYYLMAVEKGDAEAMNNLGLLYKSEYKQYDEAKKYYLMAVEKGDAKAMYNLALLYKSEYKEYDEAKKYYLMAVEKGHVSAIYNLALLFENEYKEYDEARKYYLMAVEKGNVEAMNNLGLLYKSEYKQYDEAKKYYLMAVEKGDAKAMYNLALLYKNEYKNYEDAEKYYLMAIERGDVDVKNNLANLYFETRKKKEEALTLQREAYTIEPGIKNSFTYIMVLLWNNDVEEARKVYRENFDNEVVQKDVSESVNSVLLLFLAKKQHNFVYQLFEENKYNLRDKYKPVYFALLSLLGEEHKDEFLKMGPELKETVDEVISEIKKLEVDYA